MTSNLPRRHILLNSKQQENDFVKFVKDGGFSSFSHMARYSIIEVMERFYKGSSAEIKQLQDIVGASHDSLRKDIQLILQRQELNTILLNKEGMTADTANATREIHDLVLKRDMDHGQILTKCRTYGEKTKNFAICWLRNAGYIGSHIKKVNKNGKGRENNGKK